MERARWIALVGLFILVPFFGTSQPAEKACFSVPGGFYEESPTLEIFPFYPQHHIRFTTNGNRPTAQSRLYTGPLLLDGALYSDADIYTIQVSPDYLVYVPDSVRHCIVIRAAVFDENDSCISPIATHSYFIQSLGCDTHGLPVVSLCADSLDLFDYSYGIMVPGVHYNPLDSLWTGNYFQSGEAWERRVNFEFYELNNEGVNQEAGLRTHGGKTRRFVQKCLKLFARETYGENRFEHPFFETIPQDSFKHLVLKPFLASWNFTGVPDHISNLIASGVDVESMASRPVVAFLNGEYWGIYFIHERPDEHYLEDHLGVDIDHVNLLSGWTPLVDCGTSTHFNALYRWVDTADLSTPEAFQYMEQQIDMHNFIDYQILELFLENTDWPNINMRCWQEDDGPWRWIFFDGDACVCWMTFNAFNNAVYVGDATWPSSTRATLFFRKLLVNHEFIERFSDRFHVLLNTVFSYENTAPMFESIKQTLIQEIPLQSERFNEPLDMETWTTHMGHVKWFLMKRCEYIVPVLEEFLNTWSVEEELFADLEVFPNPASGPVTIRLHADHPETTPCLVYDVTGRLVYTHELPLDAGPNTLSLDLPLSSGLYFMKIGPVVIKIVRQ